MYGIVGGTGTKGKCIAALVGILCLMSSLALTVSAEDPGWKKGDSWTYSWHATEENLSISGIVVMEVVGTPQVSVAGVMRDAFLVEVKGNGTASGIFEAVSVTATVTLNGSETRLQSDLSLVKTGFNMTMIMQALGMTVTMSVGMSASMNPPQNDLPIGVNLTGHEGQGRSVGQDRGGGRGEEDGQGAP